MRFNPANFKQQTLKILYHKEICNLQLKKRRFIRLSDQFYYKSGQWSADFITVVLTTRLYTVVSRLCVYCTLKILFHKEICKLQLKKHRFIRLSGQFYYNSGQWSADFITVVLTTRLYTIVLCLCIYCTLKILYHKEICNLQLKNRGFIRLSGQFYYN